MLDPAPYTICPACGASNQCALANDANAQQCWCMHSPTPLPLPTAAAQSCYCPNCLQKILQKQLQP